MEKFLHALNSVPSCNRRILAQLWKNFGDWRYVWEKASPEELVRAAGFNRPGGEKFARALMETRRKFDVDAEFARLWERDIVVVRKGKPEYPEVFLEMPDAPFLLYRKGAPLNSGARMMAIVGTRNPTKYGEKIAYDLAEALAEQGVIVVSGLAFGIDAVAHFATVSAKRPTIAVLASGLFDVTPSSHHRLSEKILEHGGTLISEYPPGDPAYPGRFLERNRIIAGLCEATIVIEAGETSGALVTARLANDYNRDVYAVPGDITRQQALGCLQLISQGAHPLVNVQKFLNELGLKNRAKRSRLNPEEEKIVAAFEDKACSTDELIEKTLLPIQTMNVVLTELELKGVIRRNRELMWEVA